MADSNVPSIRFKGFTDPWEQRKFSDEFVFLKNNTLSRSELSDDEGIARDVHYGDVLIKYGSVLDLEDDDLPRIADPAAVEKMTSDSLRDGDIVIADTAEDLTAGKCSELRNIGESVVFAGLHTMPCRPVNQYAAGFLGHYLNSSSFHDQLIPLMQGIKVIALSKAAMGVAALMVPSFAEQQAIGRFFSSLDSLITLHQRKYDKLVVLKKSMLEQMFPREGESAPRIRFSGFTDPWEQRKLGELYENRDERGNDDLQILSVSIYGGVSDGSLTSVELGKNVKRSEDKSLYKRVESGDAVLNMMRAWQGAIGTASVEGMVSPAYIVAKPLSSQNQRFFDVLLRRLDVVNQMNDLSYGVTDFRKRLYWDSFVRVTVDCPSLAEQQAIGRFFSRLDSLITLHQRKLELLQNIKKSLLEQMFV